MSHIDIKKLLEAVVKENEVAGIMDRWIDLQRWKGSHPAGVKYAIWHLKFFYNWDHDREKFIEKVKDGNSI